MEEPGSKASVRSRDGIQGNVLLYIGFYNNANHNIVCVHDIDFWTWGWLAGGGGEPRSGGEKHASSIDTSIRTHGCCK